MSEIKCPKCGEIINIDDTTFTIKSIKLSHDLRID